MEPPRRPSAVRMSNHRIATTGVSTPPAQRASVMPAFRPDVDSERIGLDWDDEASSFHMQAECTETKTVTTTTTIKRSYPSLVVRPERQLHNLDSKHYPLANEPTPAELSHFSYLTGERTSTSSTKVNPRALNPYASKLLEYERSRTNQPLRQIQRGECKDRPRTRGSKPPRSPESLGPSSIKSSLRYLPGPPPSRLSRSNYTQQLGSEASTQTNSPRFVELSSFASLEPDLSGEDGQPSHSFMTSGSDETTIGDEAPSPSINAAQALFPSAVATPPITDTDLEPFDQLSQALSNIESRRPNLITTGLQSASLPSPSLSPTLAAAKLHDAQYRTFDTDDTDYTAESQEADHDHSITKLSLDQPPGSRGASVKDIQSIIGAFDAMPEEMKSFMIYQFLRSCTKKTLTTVAGAIFPALKCDFLDELPGELALHILGFLDHRDRCKVAQVSRRWRTIVDSDEAGWKDLFDQAKFVLPQGELERAIAQGWGWQDPYGIDGHEADLSNLRPPSSGKELGRVEPSSESIQHTSKRSSIKRKRTAGSFGREHAKRQKDLQSSVAASGHRSPQREGPHGASLAAVLAVPNPDLGLPTLQQMHLFKSLYRRYSKFRSNWMNEKMQPYHMAFPAHPRHVITCLQFDDDKIITGSDDTYIHVYDTKTGKLRRRLEGHEGGVWALQYEGNVLVSGSTDRSVRVWDIEKGLCTQVFHGHTSTVRCLQIVMPVATGKTHKGRNQMLPEKPLIITGSRDSHLRVWKLPEQGAKRYMQTGPSLADTDCPYFVRLLTGHGHSVRAIAAHSDTLVSGSYDFSVRIWKISTGETIHVLRGHAQKVYSVVLDAARGRCISGSMDFTVKIWDLESGACLRTLEGHTSLVGLLDLQDDRLVSAAADSTLRIWNPADGSCKATLTAHTGAITCFQHDSHKVISGSDRTLKMWNVKTGECLQDLLTDLTGVWQVRFDSRRCVAAVQRDGNTYIEVLDFGASRDGRPDSERGHRVLLPPSDVDRIPIEDDDDN